MKAISQPKGKTIRSQTKKQNMDTKDTKDISDISQYIVEDH